MATAPATTRDGTAEVGSLVTLVERDESALGAYRVGADALPGVSADKRLYASSGISPMRAPGRAPVPASTRSDAGPDKPETSAAL
ncbi:hypothetical protein, partial [Piscicoccus intestinalis]|uniref:hypothetical protein n=1 Tax=Piscicoccus intestinalis TaxID=746033 RepID=UPI001C3F1EAB